MLEKLKQFFAPQDMTEGVPVKRLIQFALPLLVGNVIQQLYSTVDTIVVGRYVGDAAVAAVGVSFPIINLLLVLFMSISTGAGIMVSQYFGARQKDMLGKTVGNAIVLCLFASVIMSLMGVFLSRWLLEVLNTPADIMEMAHDYLSIFFIGLLGCVYYNILSGILRGLGDSFMPLVFLTVACVLNIGLDIWFVAGLGMATDGVALATIMAQGISAALCFMRIYRIRGDIGLTRGAFRPRRDLAWRITKLGLPSGITQAIFSMAMLLTQRLTNSFGTAVVACSVMVMRVDGFAMMPNFTFGMAMTTYSGQNIGAGRLDRVTKGTKDGLKLALLISAVLTTLILIFGRSLLLMFTDTPEVIAMSMKMLSILAVGYIAMAVTQTLSGVMRGAGDTMTPMWISLITTVAFRVPVAYGLAYLTRSAANPNGNPVSMFVSLLTAWILGAGITALFFAKGKWRKKGITGKTAPQAEAAPAEVVETLPPIEPQDETQPIPQGGEETAAV